MLKVKHERECDCVVAGFRWHKKGEGVLIGSLLLGLFDASGTLQHVGYAPVSPKRSDESSWSFSPPTAGMHSSNHPWKHWADPGR